MSRLMKAAPLVVLCVLVIAAPPAWANWVQDGTAICTATGTQGGPKVVSDGAGGAIVTWEDHRNGYYGDIYAQRVNASGAVQWATDGVAICAATGSQYSPTIVSDGAGGAIVVWNDDRAGYGYGDIYAQRVNASGAVQWATDGVAICTATGSQSSLTVVSDGAGGAIIAWVDTRSGLANPDIWAQRVNASGVLQWTHLNFDSVPLCRAPGYQVDPTIASDGAGGAIVAWEDARTGDDIYAQRVNASGWVQWTGEGVPLCTATGYQSAPTIVSDGAGGAIVTWTDSRSGNNSGIYAQRVNTSGAVQWATDGVAVCAATGEKQSPEITFDGAGGAIVTWHDARSGPYDLYAQRVNASGAVQWTAEGVVVCGTPVSRDYPWYKQIISDGAGGAIVTWNDEAEGIFGDIYAQRVNASGVVRWTANGVALCTATGIQDGPAIISDGWGGAIVAWNDDRNAANPDIYAQRVDANGFALLTATDAPAVPIELQQNYPNPFNPTTTMTYSVPERCNVVLKIYDVSGKCIARLVDKEQEKGSYSVAWNGKDETGSSLASGIYLYRLSAGNQTIAKKMVLLR